MILSLFVFPLLVANFKVKPPCTTTIISRNTQYLLLVVEFHGRYCQIFHIWSNRLIGDPFYNLSYWPLIWISIRTMSIGFSTPFYIALFATLVTSCTWIGRKISTIVIIFTTMVVFEINLIFSLDDCLFNLPSGSF